MGGFFAASPGPGTPAPIWLRVDLGAFYWINRWVVKQMGAVGWSPNYNLTDYKLQGSLDNANWFDIDTVTNNSANQTDRAIYSDEGQVGQDLCDQGPPVQYQFCFDCGSGSI